MGWVVTPAGAEGIPGQRIGGCLMVCGELGAGEPVEAKWARHRVSGGVLAAVHVSEGGRLRGLPGRKRPEFARQKHALLGLCEGFGVKGFSALLVALDFPVGVLWGGESSPFKVVPLNHIRDHWGLYWATGGSLLPANESRAQRRGLAEGGLLRWACGVPGLFEGFESFPGFERPIFNPCRGCPREPVCRTEVEVLVMGVGHRAVHGWET